MQTFYTPPEVAKMLRVRSSKITYWIASGELRAFNVTGKPGGRPRWRISEEALEEFKRDRTPHKAPPRRPTSRYDGPPLV